MLNTNKEKIINFLKTQPKTGGLYSGRFLCFDKIDERRIDIDFLIDYNELFIGGDDGDSYQFDEIELIDELVLNQ